MDHVRCCSKTVNCAWTFWSHLNILIFENFAGVLCYVLTESIYCIILVFVSCCFYRNEISFWIINWYALVFHRIITLISLFYLNIDNVTCPCHLLLDFFIVLFRGLNNTVGLFRSFWNWWYSLLSLFLTSSFSAFCLPYICGTANAILVKFLFLYNILLFLIGAFSYFF